VCVLVLCLWCVSGIYLDFVCFFFFPSPVHLVPPAGRIRLIHNDIGFNRRMHASAFYAESLIFSLSLRDSVTFMCHVGPMIDLGG